MADLRRISLLSFLLSFLATAGCSGLSTLTPDVLHAQQQRWNSAGPSYYSMIVEMKGDRIETSRYAVTVRDKNVVKLERNGLLISPGGGLQDYSIDGLFHILDQELDLAKKPEILGAPPGWGAYTMASFDAATGRLLRYQRSVGETKNGIEINVQDFRILGQ